MFQNIVNATEPMPDEKEAINYISNNPTRKEIIMYVTDSTVFVKRFLKPLHDLGVHVVLPDWLLSHLQGHDDDRLWLVSYLQTLGGTEQGGWPSL